MLAPRELNSDNLAESIRTWENIHFRYTHGYGLVMSPVNEIEGEGLPNLLIKDIPPVSSYPELSKPGRRSTTARLPISTSLSIHQPYRSSTTRLATRIS